MPAADWQPALPAGIDRDPFCKHAAARTLSPLRHLDTAVQACKASSSPHLEDRASLAGQLASSEASQGDIFIHHRVYSRDILYQHHLAAAHSDSEIGYLVETDHGDARAQAGC